MADKEPTHSTISSEKSGDGAMAALRKGGSTNIPG